MLKMPELSQRQFLQSATAVCSALVMPLVSRSAAAGWEDITAILARIQAPKFPKRDFDIRKYGAVGDGVKECRIPPLLERIQPAI